MLQKVLLLADRETEGQTDRQIYKGKTVYPLRRRSVGIKSHTHTHTHTHTYTKPVSLFCFYNLYAKMLINYFVYQTVEVFI